MPVPLSRFLPLFGCLVLIAFASALAQQPARAPRTAPAPTPLPPPALPADPNAGPTPEPADVHLVFPNPQVADILLFYEGLSGKHVIMDNSVQGQINIPTIDKTTRSEAMRIIEVALNLNGFALVPAEGNIVKVLGLGKPIRNQDPPIFTELTNLPDTEAIVSFLVRLRYLDAQETSQLLTQYIPPSSSIAFIPLPKAGAILITDTAHSVRRLVSLIAQLDLPASPVIERFIPLVRADATKAVEFLNSVFETKSSGGTASGQPGNVNAVTAVNPNVRRPIRRGIEDGQPEVPGLNINNPTGNASLGTLSGDQLILGRITLTADVRTNRIHVVTSPLNMPLVEKLIHDYDADTPFATPVRRPLRFRNARDVLPILVQALTEKGDEGGNGNSGTPGSSTSSNNRSTSGNNSNVFSNLNSNGGSGGSGSSGGSSNIGSEGLDTQPVDTTPTEATVGTTKLIADPSSNTIILLGNAEAKDKVFEILDQLDVRGAQVIIRTVIGELSLGNGNEFGLNYLARTKRIGAFSQFNSSLVNAFGDGTATTASPAASPTTTSTLNTLSTLASGLPSGFAGLGGIIAVGKSFDIILSALDSTNRFKTVSRPMIFTQNNKKAIIASGQEIAVPTNSVGSTTGTTAGTVGTYTNIDYKNVTLQLEVVPLINSDHEVTLDILQKIDSVVAGSSTTVNGNSVPTIATRYLKSTVSAPNKSTIVLGGLITQDDNRTDNDIPYLGRIPILGVFFRSRTHNVDRSELIILMHPEVVNTPPALIAAREKEEDRTYLGGGLENQILPLEVRKAIPVYPTPTPRPRYRPAPTPAPK